MPILYIFDDWLMSIIDSSSSEICNFLQLQLSHSMTWELSQFRQLLNVDSLKMDLTNFPSKLRIGLVNFWISKNKTKSRTTTVNVNCPIIIFIPSFFLLIHGLNDTVLQRKYKNNSTWPNSQAHSSAFYSSLKFI